MEDNTIPDVEPSYPVLVREAHQALGGRASLDDVIFQVRHLNPERWERQALSALRNETRKALTEHGADGMPHASSIGDQYVARQLFDVSDYETVVGRYIAQSDDLLATAERLAEECDERYGVSILVPKRSAS